MDGSSRDPSDAIRRPSPLNAWVGRLPGPVWTLAVYAGIAAINLSVVLFLGLVPHSGRILVTGAAVGAVAIIISLWLLASRTPTWLLHVYVVAIIGMATLVMVEADTAVNAVTAGFGYLTISLYVSYWMPRSQSLFYVFLMSLLYLLVIAASGWTDLLAPWMLTVATMLVVLFVLSALRQALESAATTDELTGLLNRHALDSLIVTNTTDRRERRRTIIAIDLDEFKRLNDAKGHAAGDRALRDFGDACLRTIRPGDLAFRTGGDEFVLILDGIAPEDVAGVITRLRASTTLEWSYGSAQWDPRMDFTEAMTEADARLYTDKLARK